MCTEASRTSTAHRSGPTSPEGTITPRRLPLTHTVRLRTRKRAGSELSAERELWLEAARGGGGGGSPAGVEVEDEAYHIALLELLLPGPVRAATVAAEHPARRVHQPAL